MNTIRTWLHRKFGRIGTPYEVRRFVFEKAAAERRKELGL
jgi:hypothetical protein